MMGAYALVLAALKLAPAAPVSAVRETSVLIAVVVAGGAREQYPPRASHKRGHRRHRSCCRRGWSEQC